MKKLMIAGAVAAMTAGAFAECGETPTPVTEEIVRCYQIQLNTYTTKGQAVGGDTVSGGQCGEDTTGTCAVLRGKDKTVIRGYVWTCADSCELKDYKAILVDVKRKGVGTAAGIPFNAAICNVISANFDQAEIAWDLEDEFVYDEKRSQKYTLKGAGYGQLRKGYNFFFDNFAGYFAGTAEGSYDFSTSSKKNECACDRSQVVTCESGEGTYLDKLHLVDADTVAFGSWKMKFNANVTKALLTNTPESYLLGLLKKLFNK